MPASILHAGRFRLLSIAGCICLLALSNAWLPAAPQHAPPHSAFEKAQRMREALEGRPERQRTRRDYDRVIEAYRAIYHRDPASPKADASASAVADLLAEEGRIFEDEKALHDAIAQYEFLRKQYPGSRYRFSALLTEGEIYLRDLNDRESARATFQEFLKLYPQNPLANEARIELTNLRKAPAKSPRSGTAVAQAPEETSRTGASTATAKHSSAAHRTVLAAAIQSQDENAGPPAQSSSNTTPAAAAALPKTAQASQPSERANKQLAESDIPPPAQRSEPAEPAHESEAALNATPPPRKGRLPLVTGIRHGRRRCTRGWPSICRTRCGMRRCACRIPTGSSLTCMARGSRRS